MPFFGALGDGQVGNVLAVQQDLAARRALDAHDELGQRRLAPPFGPVITVKRPSGMVSDRSSMMRFVSFDPSASGTSKVRFLSSSITAALRILLVYLILYYYHYCGARSSAAACSATGASASAVNGRDDPRIQSLRTHSVPTAYSSSSARTCASEVRFSGLARQRPGVRASGRGSGGDNASNSELSGLRCGEPEGFLSTEYLVAKCATP